MTEKDMILTEIICAAIRNKEVEIEKLKSKSINWNNIYFEAQKHQIHTLIYPVIKNVASQIELDPKLMALWNISVLACGIQMICDEVGIGDVIETFDTFGIESIVLKGMSINKYYPNPELRSMKAADILVHKEDQARVTEILKTFGYLSQEDQNAKHIGFFKDKALPINIHILLVGDELLKETEIFHSEVWEQPKEIKVGLAKVYTLSLEMQIIYLCIQMAIEITNRSLGLRHLSDLVIVVEKNKEIDWNIVKTKIIKYCVEEFVITIFEVCNRLFQMKVPKELAHLNKKNYENIERLIGDIFKDINSRKKELHRASKNTFSKSPPKDSINKI